MAWPKQISILNEDFKNGMKWIINAKSRKLLDDVQVYPEEVRQCSLVLAALTVRHRFIKSDSSAICSIFDFDQSKASFSTITLVGAGRPYRASLCCCMTYGR
jgi:hypothetical protein